ncbi:MAG TPA: rod shape-determining protein MreC [Candidatus Cybelea sp.]|nr:rod shape-determining protein MreC [Candidatus Cybelea sp.]
MFKRKNYLALGAVVLVAVLVLSLPASATSRLKLVISSWFLPLFGLANAAQQLPADLADGALPRRELLQQINALRHENEQLKTGQLQAAATARENDQLRALFDWKKQVSWQLELAQVVMRDPANWWRTVQIDRGTRDGLRENLPVLTSDGLVGRISSVRLASAQVVLIGDPNCRVSALVENITHDIGVLNASGPLDPSLVELSYLTSGANLQAGQNVVTSGLGGIFPKGIPIGKVVDAQSIEFGLATEARVKLNANPGALEQVWVLMNPQTLSSNQ